MSPSSVSSQSVCSKSPSVTHGGRGLLGNFRVQSARRDANDSVTNMSWLQALLAFLRFLNLADLYDPWILAPFVVHSLRILLAVIRHQTDELLTCLWQISGSTQPMDQKELMVRLISYQICFRMLSYHRRSCRARCAKHNSIPSQSPTILPTDHFELV